MRGMQSAPAKCRLLACRSLLPSISDHILRPSPCGGSIADVRYGSSLAVKGGHYYVSKGTGGRSSVSGIIATVFGATGFLGRYVVQQLAKIGSQVMVPYRGSEDSPRHLKLMGDLGQIVPMKYHPHDENSIKTTLSKSNVVINLIGRDYETRNYSFEDVHVGITECLSRLAREHGGIIRYIQVSCLGASLSSPSRMLRTKAHAEALALANFPEATILQPAPMIGTEDRLLNKWAMQAKRHPFLTILGNSATKLQPVHVMDVASAVIAAVRDDGSSMGHIYQLGGPDIFTVNELVHLTFDIIREHPRIVSLPRGLVKLVAAPFASARDNLDSMLVDRLVSPQALTFKDMGIVPRKLQGFATDYLLAYRAGGPSVGTTVGEQIGSRY